MHEDSHFCLLMTKWTTKMINRIDTKQSLAHLICPKSPGEKQNYMWWLKERIISYSWKTNIRQHNCQNKFQKKIYLIIENSSESFCNCQMAAFIEKWVGQSTFWLGEYMARKVKLDKLLSASFVSKWKKN